PTKGWFTFVVWDWFDNDLFAVRDHTQRLEHDHRPITADNPEKFVVRDRASKRDFKTEHIAIERERCRDVGEIKTGEMREIVGSVIRVAPLADPIFPRRMRFRISRV